MFMQKRLQTSAKIMDPLRDQGRACLGRRERVAVQNVIAQNNGPKFQSVDRVKAPLKNPDQLRTNETTFGTQEEKTKKAECSALRLGRIAIGDPKLLGD